jgi:dynein heavy chain
VQLSIANGDLTTTWIPFQYFYNTEAEKSLAIGPGLLTNCSVGNPVEFLIIARNKHGENRTSGRDNFQVKVTRTIPADPEVQDAKPTIVEIPCSISDTDTGSYKCEYKCDEKCETEVHILFEDDKGRMVPIRGSPYKSSFVGDLKPAENLITGNKMIKQIESEVKRMQGKLADTKKEIIIKDKNLKDVKCLLKVKENVEQTFDSADQITLEIDQLEESLKLFQTHKVYKENNSKFLKVSADWTNLKKLAKDTKKEINPLV